MRSLAIGVFLFVVISSLTNPARAQSAEETVLFMLIGLEQSVSGKIPVIQRIDNCRYDMVLPDRTKLEFNLSQMNLYRAGFQDADRVRVYISVRGQDLYRVKGETVSFWDFIVEQGGSIERLEKAAAYFKSTFCKGRAF
jgi:hypothetical protein